MSLGARRNLISDGDRIFLTDGRPELILSSRIKWEEQKAKIKGETLKKGRRAPACRLFAIIGIRWVPEISLRNFHQEIIAILGAHFGPVRPHHLPVMWHPHCTVAYELSAAELLSSVQVCRESGIFGKVSLVEAVIVGSGGNEIAVFAFDKSS